MPVLAQYSCPPRDIQASDEVEGIKFEAKGCQRQGKKVVCSAWLTATEKDGVLIVFGKFNDTSTRLIDSDGNTYLPSLVQAGRIETQGGRLDVRVSKDVPLKATSTFMEISPSARDISLFEIATTYGFSTFQIGKLRNLKITEGRAESTQVPAKPPQKKRK